MTDAIDVYVSDGGIDVDVSGLAFVPGETFEDRLAAIEAALPGPWHVIGDPGEIAYGSGWSAAAAPLRYRIENDLIRFDGSAVQSGGSPVVCQFTDPAPVTSSAVASISDNLGGLNPAAIAVFNIGDGKQSLLSFAATDTTTNFASIVLPLVP